MIKSQVIYSKLTAISREMGQSLARTSRSSLIAEDSLFATAILTGDLRLVVQHQNDPGHLYAMKEAITRMFEYFAFDLTDGDVLIVGDTFVGGTQPQMITIATPVFREGEIRFFPAARMPLMDLGGEYPGAFHPEATEIWQECMRVTPLKLFRGGVPQNDIMRFLCTNSRVPRLLSSDLGAVLGVCRTAGRQIDAFLRRYGVGIAMSAVADILRYTELRVRTHLAQLSLPAQGEASVRIDARTEQKVHVRLERDGDGVVLDFTGTSPQSPGSCNSTTSATRALAVLPLLAPLLDEMEVNEGIFAPFRFKLPDGSAVNPRFPAATSLGPSSTWHSISHAVHRALRSVAGEGDATGGCRLDGVGPRAVLFAPIGTVEESIPLYLEPGFPIAADGWGPPALHGRRRLVSAEEMEARDHLQLVSRELVDNGGMRVRVANHRGPLEANFFVPGSSTDTPGAIRVTASEVTFDSTAATAFPLASNAVIEIDYPRIREAR